MFDFENVDMSETALSMPIWQCLLAMLALAVMTYVASKMIG